MTEDHGGAAAAERFRRAHHEGRPLVVANAWDAASAAVFVEAGLDAIATSSGAVARSLGFTDGEGTPPDEVFAAIARIATAARAHEAGLPSVMVTADIEHGYGLDAADLVARLARAGAVGCNLEDSDPRTRTMDPVEEQVGRLAALRRAADQAGTGLVINARVDIHVRADGPEETRLERSMARARAYLEAGADCVFPIMLSDDDDIAAYVRGVAGPVNVMATLATPGCAAWASWGSPASASAAASIASPWRPPRTRRCACTRAMTPGPAETPPSTRRPTDGAARSAPSHDPRAPRSSRVAIAQSVPAGRGARTETSARRITGRAHEPVPPHHGAGAPRSRPSRAGTRSGAKYCVRVGWRSPKWTAVLHRQACMPRGIHADVRSHWTRGRLLHGRRPIEPPRASTRRRNSTDGLPHRTSAWPPEPASIRRPRDPAMEAHGAQRC